MNLKYENSRGFSRITNNQLQRFKINAPQHTFKNVDSVKQNQTFKAVRLIESGELGRYKDFPIASAGIRAAMPMLLAAVKRERELAAGLTGVTFLNTRDGISNGVPTDLVVCLIYGIPVSSNLLNAPKLMVND